MSLQAMKWFKIWSGEFKKSLRGLSVAFQTSRFCCVDPRLHCQADLLAVLLPFFSVIDSYFEFRKGCTAGPSRSGQGEGLTVGVLPVLETLFVLGEAVVRLGAHGLGQVPEGSRVVQVQLLLPQHKTHALLPQNALL